MKNITILILLFCFACSKPASNVHKETSQSANKQDFAPFEWLVGVWERSMSGDDQINHFESWTLTKNGLRGTGTTILGEEVTNEDILIKYSNDSLLYVAHPAQNESPTSFLITEINDSFFRCENEAHDSPKYIEYHRQGDTLTAFIGDAKQRTRFQFKLQNERDFR